MSKHYGKHAKQVVKGFKEVLDAKRKAANLGSTGMPDKLADCRTHGDDAELLIVEGDSAAGPAKAGGRSRRRRLTPDSPERSMP